MGCFPSRASSLDDDDQPHTDARGKAQQEQELETSEPLRVAKEAAGPHLVAHSREVSCPAELGDVKFKNETSGSSLTPDAQHPTSRLHDRRLRTEALCLASTSLSNHGRLITEAHPPNQEERGSCSRTSNGRVSTRFSARVSPSPMESNLAHLRSSGSTSRMSLQALSDRLKAERSKRDLLPTQTMDVGHNAPRASVRLSGTSQPGLRRLFSEPIDNSDYASDIPRQNSGIEKMLAGLTITRQGSSRRSQGGRTSDVLSSRTSRNISPSKRRILQEAQGSRISLSDKGYQIDSVAHQSILKSMDFALSLAPPPVVKAERSKRDLLPTQTMDVGHNAPRASVRLSGTSQPGLRRLFSEPIDNSDYASDIPRQNSGIEKMLAGLTITRQGSSRRSQGGRTSDVLSSRTSRNISPSKRRILQEAQGSRISLSDKGYQIDSVAHQSILKSMDFALSLAPPPVFEPSATKFK